MPLIRGTSFFVDSSHGWSETIFQTATSVDAAMPGFINLTNARGRLLPPSIQIQGVRGSDDAVFRDARFAAGGADSLVGNGTNPVATVAPVDVAVKLRLEAGVGHRRSMELRALPQTVVGSNDAYLFANPVWRPLLDAYLNLLRPTVIGIPIPSIYQIRIRDVAQPALPINSVALATNPLYLSIVVPGELMANRGSPPIPALTPVKVGDRVYIKGMTGTSKVNGIWQVVNIIPGATYSYLLGPHRELAQLPGAIPPFWPGTVQFLAYVGASIDSAVDESLSNRKTGRPSGVQPGKRRVA